MKSTRLLGGAALLCTALWLVPVFAQSAALDTASIERLTGLKGALNEKEGVFKVSFPARISRPRWRARE